MVEDNEWFFDTELLVLAEKLGYRIFDLPVPWIEARSSSVKIFRTVSRTFAASFAFAGDSTVAKSPAAHFPPLFYLKSDLCPLTSVSDL